MNDREQFTRQTEEKLQLLQEAIRNLDVPLVEKEKVLGLAHDLRESAYQAGLAEAQEIVANLIESQI